MIGCLPHSYYLCILFNFIVSMKLYKHLILLCALALTTLNVRAQKERLWTNIEYNAELNAVYSDGDYAPFWLTSNKYGLSSIKNKSGYLRAGLFRSAANDSARNWRIGYGIDVAAAVRHSSKFIPQQWYFDVHYKRVALSMGQKERPMELRNQALSSGAMTSGINARPVPQVRFELPNYWTIPGTKNWVHLKAHIAYGLFTDDSWQTDFVSPGRRYNQNVLYHSKAGFLRIGNLEKFPITLTGGFEMNAQFGGEAWNVIKRPDDTSDFDPSYVYVGHGLSQFWNAFIPGGSDATDGDYKNVEGNHLGSWHISAQYHANNWSVRGYAEHFYEDHSQLFWQYGWKDMVYGVEAELPKNPFVNTLVYEHIRTNDQTGGVYHDATDIVSDQISGMDNYYNNAMYTGWQHWGMGMGNPLLISPIYNNDGRIEFKHNRIVAHHFGVSGQPCTELGYRILYTHTKSWGTYVVPTTDPKYGNYFMLELNYQPRFLKGFSFIGAVATNGGSLLGNSKGAMITIRKSGILGRK